MYRCFYLFYSLMYMDTYQRQNDLNEASRSLRCLIPIKLDTPSGTLLVPCGHCNACLTSRSSRLRKHIQQHASGYKYTFFVTLTYSPECVPTYHVSFDTTDSFIGSDNMTYYRALFVRTRYFDFVRSSVVTPEMDKYRVLSESDPANSFEKYVTSSEIESFSTMQHYNDSVHDVMLCSVYDVQKFIKRLRAYYYSFKKQSYGKNYEPNSSFMRGLEQRQSYRVASSFLYDSEDAYRGKTLGELYESLEPEADFRRQLDLSYYYTLEYGGSTRRPHCHLLFFTNSDFIALTLAMFVNKSWRCGITDFQLSYGHAASYVSSYVTSFALLPAFIRYGYGCSSSSHSCFNIVPPAYKSLSPQVEQDIRRYALDGNLNTTDSKPRREYLPFDILCRLYLRPKRDVLSSAADFHRLFYSAYRFVSWSQTELGHSVIEPLNLFSSNSVVFLSEWSVAVVHLIISKCLVNGSFDSQSYDALPSFVQDIIEYLDLRSFLISQQYLKYASDYMSGLYCLFYNRLGRFISAIKCVCVNRHVVTLSDYDLLVRYSYEFWTEYSKHKLASLYKKTENASAEYASMLFYLSSMQYDSELLSDTGELSSSDVTGSSGFDFHDFLQTAYYSQSRMYKPRIKHNPNV